MSIAWSEHAEHVQTLFAPWRPGDGYAEDDVRAAETLLSITLPATLRAFYRAWGRRDDLARRSDRLLAPGELFVESGALVLCVENQAVLYWAIPCEALAADDPPVCFARLAWAADGEEPDVGPWELSHDHVSDFLDGLAYHHAFCGDAMHGGTSREHADARRLARVKLHWRESIIRSAPWGLIPDSTPRSWPIYIRDGQAIVWSDRFLAAARSPEDLDQIAQVVELSWQRRW